MAGLGVDRHLGMLCVCALLECCHNEQEREFNCGRGPEVHVHSGNPWTGHLYPWTPEEYDAWRRYWDRPDPGEHPDGSLERLVIESELRDWRERERRCRS